MEVKCKCHGIKINRDTAYKVVVNNKSEYYCTEIDYKKIREEKDNRKNILALVDKIFGYTITNTILSKELSELSKIYSYGNMFTYINLNFCMLEKAMSRQFSSEFGKIKYFTTILKNNLRDYKPLPEEPIKEKDIEMIAVKYKPRPRKKSIGEYLEEVEG